LRLVARRHDNLGDEPLPLERGYWPQEPPPEPWVRQPRLLLVIVPAVLIEIALAVYALSRPGEKPPVAGAVFFILIIGLLGFLIYQGSVWTRWMLAGLWVLRGTLAIGAAIGRGSGWPVYALGSFYLVAATVLLVIPRRRGEG
jgi:hypothetical protein